MKAREKKGRKSKRKADEKSKRKAGKKAREKPDTKQDKSRREKKEEGRRKAAETDMIIIRAKSIRRSVHLLVCRFPKVEDQRENKRVYRLYTAQSQSFTINHNQSQ